MEPTPKPISGRMIIVVGIMIAVVAAGVALAVLLPARSHDSSRTQSPTQTTTSTAASTNASTITFTDQGFSPSTLTVTSGTVVTVVNSSSNSLQFSSDDHPSHLEDPEINMARLTPGESGTFTAKTVGTHGFHDHIDDTKTGTLIVTN